MSINRIHKAKIDSFIEDFYTVDNHIFSTVFLPRTLMKNISRSPFLWVSATALSAMLYFFAFHFFPQTFPIINLSITMDLEQALEQAHTIAEKNNIGPVDHHNAAMFDTDNTVKTFIELEAGGKDAFVSMMEDSLYMPYTWKVRHFKEHEKNEATILFTPDGKPYGFVETISENVAGEQLSEKDARSIAEEKAVTDWNIDFTNYTLVEASQKTEVSKRIDHTFVYERTDKKIGEGTYRLKIVVSGDKISQLVHFVKVPEAFTRRYAEMRSANAIVSLAATLFMILVYFLGGGFFGLYWIIRKRWYLIKQPLLCALILSSLSTLASINQLPFLWMQYNSAFTINMFLARLLISLLISFMGQTALYTLIIAAAESLTRRAFGNHPQLWSVFSLENSVSSAIVGRTIGAYLLVGFNVAFVIGFYLLSLRYLGWWSPSEMLFNPNILATYAPWFSPLALSLNAGFIEECLFRAIPLAGAALLGTHFGKRNWWIAAAFIIQAIIFGAAHANYPVQPSYARLIELLIPSFIWGAIYLKFGLLSTIIAHYVYDVIWFSIPIFITSMSDALAYKCLIIIGALLPLLRICYAYARNGRWTHLPQSERNSAWQPSEINEDKQEEITTTPHDSETSSFSKNIIYGLGIIGLIGWIYFTPFTHDGVTISLDKNEAVTHADSFLEKKGFILDAPWKTLPVMFTHYNTMPQIANQHKFIWKKGKKELYHQLLGTYLEPAHWTIRYAQFDTDIVQRAEEHKVLLNNQGAFRHYHQLPEDTVGESLTQEQARTLAHTTVREQFNVDPATLTEISAVQAQLPHRINWLFIFANESIYPLATGQARISVAISGNEVTDAACTIHVPEEWERKEQNKQNTFGILTLIIGFILAFSMLIGLILAFRRKRTILFSKRLFFMISGASILIDIIYTLNIWPTIVGSFTTHVPLQSQLFQTIAVLVVVTGIKALIVACMVSYVLLFKTAYKSSHQAVGTTVCTGTNISLFVAGIVSCAQFFVPTNMPLWPSYNDLGSAIPLLTSILNVIIYYFRITTTCSLLYILVDTATDHWQKNRLLFTFIAALLGMDMIDLLSMKLLPLWIILGTVIGLLILELYKRILRYNYSLIPIITGNIVILSCIQQGIFNAYPHALPIAVVKICTVTLLSLAWHRYTSKE